MLKNYSRFRLPILTYHNISDAIDYYIAVEPKTFRYQIKTLLNRFSYIDLQTAFEQYERSEPLINKFSITFDDGYEDIIPALHYLEKRNIKATIFIPTDSIGKNNRWNYKATYISRILDYKQLKKLSGVGHLIGSHGKTHQCLTKLPDGELIEEVSASKKELENKLNRKVSLFSYPFGYHDLRVRKLASKYYRAAFATNKTAKYIDWKDIFQIHRLSVNRDTSLRTIIGYIESCYEA